MLSRVPVVICLVSLTYLVQTLVYSIPLPGLPLYLYKDGCNLTQGQYGLIMATSTAVTVIGQPIVGKLLVATVSDKFMIWLGLLVNGAFTVLMMLLERLHDPTAIFVYALVCHALASCGHSMSSVAVYSSLGTHLSTISHIMLPVFDVIFGVAMFAGPLLGGPLYDKAGLSVVYLVAGGICLIVCLLTVCLYPTSKSDSKKDNPSTANYSILMKWPIILNIIMIAHCYCMMSYNDVTLTNRLMNVMDVWPGNNSFAVFGVCGASFALLGVAFGLLAKKVSDTRIFVLLSLPVGVVSWLLISTVFNAQRNLLWMYAGQLFLGLTMSPMFICCYIFTLKYLGGDSDPGVYAIVSGVFSPTANLGAVLGQMLSSYLVVKKSTFNILIGPDSAMIALNVILAFVLLISICFDRMKK